jgi:hypothetical protein
MTSHPIGLLFVCTIVVLAIVVALWTFLPAFRDRMKGYSTVAEGFIGIGLGLFGQFAGAIQDAQAAGYIPPALVTYVPFIICLWFILKRFGTDTAVGQK